MWYVGETHNGRYIKIIITNDHRQQFSNLYLWHKRNMGCTGSTAVVENILPIELVVNLDDQESLHDNLLGAEVKCVAPGVHECISASAASLSATNIESTDIERIQYDSGYFKPKEAEVEMEFTTKMLQSRDIAPPGTGQVNIQGDNCDPNNDEYLQKKIQLRDLSRSNALADNRGETFENGSYSYGITTKAGDQSTSMSLRPVGKNVILAPFLPFHELIKILLGFVSEQAHPHCLNNESNQLPTIGVGATMSLKP